MDTSMQSTSTTPRPKTRSQSLLEEVKRSMFRTSEPMRTQVIEYTIKTKSGLDDENASEDVRDDQWGVNRVLALFKEIVEYVWNAEDISSKDNMGMSIWGGDLTWPIQLPIRPYHSPEFQRRAILNEIERIQQSKRDWMMGSRLSVTVTITRDIKARGRKPTLTIMTPELLRDQIDSGVLMNIRDAQYGEHEGNSAGDTVLALTRRTNIRNYSDPSKIDSFLHISKERMRTELNVQHSDTWQDVLTKWCAVNPTTNVMVLSQIEGMGTHHKVVWRSTFSNKSQAWVMWYDETLDHMLDVIHPNQLYTGNSKHKLCLECGTTYDKRNLNHNCSGEEMGVSYRPGKKRPHFKCTERQKVKKKSRRTNNNKENCVGYALYTAMVEKGYELTTLEGKTLSDWYEEMGMQDTWNMDSGMVDIKRWADCLDRGYGTEDNGFELCVYHEKERRIMFSFKGAHPKKTMDPIYLNYEEGHVTWISSMAGWLGRSYFCNKCKKGYSNTNHHKCVRPCLRCGEENHDHYQPRSSEYVTCSQCNRWFWNALCYRSHLVSRYVNDMSYTTCQRKYKCLECGVTVDKRKRIVKNKKQRWVMTDGHVCFQYNCTVCGEDDVTRGEHQCYIRGMTEMDQDEERPFYLAFFDFETRCLEDNHVVNKVVVLMTCRDCFDYIEDHETRGCAGLCGRRRLMTFDTVVQFMEWVLGDDNEKLTKYTFLAHNLKGYDAYPILEECVKRGVLPQCIYQGAKVMMMIVKGVTFKDSLCFIPMALRKFPSTFGTLTGGEKGYFPHFFNTLEHSDYVGRYPALEYYGIDDMNDKDKADLSQWWGEQEGKTFNLQEELTKYCIQDVMVMAMGCLKFRQLYVDKFNVDPFSECVTIASTCLTVFKKNFLKPRTMGVVPPLGYRQSDIQSIEALEWLHSLNISPLMWAGCAEGEAKLLGAKVDGYDVHTNTIYQYHGCYWHGCPICFKDRHVIHSHLGMTMEDLYDKTQTRTRNLRTAGFHVVEMWGHVWDVRRCEVGPPPHWIESRNPIHPRQSMTGGRTNAIKLYAYTRDSPDDDDDVYGKILRRLSNPVDFIRYIDVVSLYPEVMWSEEYPLGHPIILVGNELPLTPQGVENIEQDRWFGIVKCDVDPPRALFFPVLPLVYGHKLMFTLCAHCMEQDESDDGSPSSSFLCHHTVVERRLRNGIWTTSELKVALSVGYAIHTIHEVWHYESKSSNLFRPYIRDNLKMKMEASGWPSYCTTDEAKDRFVAGVKESQGIVLDRDNIAKNPGLRSVAKLNLNSLWGKFAQNPFKSKVEYVSDPERYFSLLHDDSVQVKMVLLLSDTVIQVNYDEYKETVRSNPNGNVVIAAFVTSWARLRLYEKLSLLGPRVLYHDTDSIIYTTSDGEEEVKTGDRLGEWSDECGDSNTNWITEFVSLGPKTYSYRTKSRECVNKCKGISLTPGARELVHMNSMKQLLVNTDEKVKVNYPRKIVRDSVHKQLKTVSMDKEVRLVYTKRKRGDDGITTYPYGY